MSRADTAGGDQSAGGRAGEAAIAARCEPSTCSSRISIRAERAGRRSVHRDTSRGRDCRTRRLHSLLRRGHR